ncbi:homoserine dehydrogenase [Halobacillus sp. K22]|uniref:homoserine dehydrogenase n=1 Tax=Halobacillus sp. K22 TaxID=3457431 RepID=UPI003FCCF79F
MTMRVAFIGFGGVGQSLAKIMKERQEDLNNEYGLDFSIVAVADMRLGAVYQPEGLNLDLLFEGISKHATVEAYPEDHQTVKGWSSLETIKNSNADVIVEVTFTDVKTGEPAISHCRTAFAHGKSVVTTNKGPVALAYEELLQLAEEKGVFFGFEGTVMSGTPALRMPETTLAGNQITQIKGILNGTTNYMITEMEKGLSYKEALEKAQKLGYAEADPTSDVEGYDARYKASILSSHVMRSPIPPHEVECEGISGLNLEKIKEAWNNGEKWRLIARVEKNNGRVKASVKPERVPMDDPLAGVTGATNAIVYECDLAGPIMLTGAGAGLKETGYSLLIDLIHYHKQRTPTKI